MQVVVDDVLLNYKVVNPKPKKVVLLLHGWGQSGENWLDTANQMSNEWKYVILDLPGFGKSSFISGVADVPDYSNLITKLIKKLKLEDVVIMGHSFGGQIGLKIAIDSPTLLKKLILVSPAGIRKRTIRQQLKVFVFSNFSSIKRLLPTKINEKLIKFVSTTDYSNSSQEHRNILKKITQYDLTDRLNEIQISSKILWGDKDKDIPFMGKTMVEEIPDSELYVMYGSDHNPHVFNASELVRMTIMCLEIR